MRLYFDDAGKVYMLSLLDIEKETTLLERFEAIIQHCEIQESQHIMKN